ncbi:MAG: flagellar biosynthesis anti-sigma factor FlgM [Acidobacteria bacterium]|nr:flagellar biosynthesis anti-sigma factor FlgM [Acidobacteriota bacterium]
MPIDGINENAKLGPVLFSSKSHHAHGSNGRAAPSQERDEVQISDRSQEFLRIRHLVDAQPDVRLDRVNKLAKAIDAGTYNVKGEQIAEAIIQKHLIDVKG